MANAVSRRDIRLRAEVLEKAFNELRRLPYSAFRDVADRPYTRIVAGRRPPSEGLTLRTSEVVLSHSELPVPVERRARSAAAAAFPRATHGRILVVQLTTHMAGCLVRNAGV